ncbi:MAG: hypothetical protein EKK55_00970 [Rhodocyclaceae bacterium]|nr:MAG: hypothetical protein EKK55_00970 [Rhodocyclaceae bacterium]
MRTTLQNLGGNLRAKVEAALRPPAQSQPSRPPIERRPSPAPATPKRRAAPTTAPAMNRAEAAYAAVLETRVRNGEIESYAFERVKFRIGHRCWYTPDFEVQRYDGRTEIHEVKVRWKNGEVGMREDARVKLHALAQLRPKTAVMLCVREVNGSWNVERIQP